MSEMRTAGLAEYWLSQSDLWLAELPGHGVPDEAISDLRKNARAAVHEAIEATERAILAQRDAEVERLRRELETARAFHRLAVKERDYERALSTPTETAARVSPEVQRTFTEAAMQTLADEGQRYDAAPSAGDVRRKALEWEDTRDVRFDGTMLFGKGYDFHSWEHLREETSTACGRFAVWKCPAHGWSYYGGKLGFLEGGFASEDEAKSSVEAIHHSYLTPAPSQRAREAARVLLDAWLVGAFEDSADAAADDAITSQWAHVDRTYPDAAPIIEAWLRALTETEDRG